MNLNDKPSLPRMPGLPFYLSFKQVFKADNENSNIITILSIFIFFIAGAVTIVHSAFLFVAFEIPEPERLRFYLLSLVPFMWSISHKKETNE